MVQTRRFGSFVESLIKANLIKFAAKASKLIEATEK